MSNTYVKKYDVGQIKLDLPYANYIHELPLLSFGDVQNTINLNLVFNYANRNDNPFHIASGYKLNLQKRIVFTDGEPSEFEESNGKRVSLMYTCGGYTFDDKSQRVLRSNSSGYEMEYPDFSKETYNDLGYITGVYSKYDKVNPFLVYEYAENKLSSITCRGTKTINFSYNTSAELASIGYAGKTVDFVYENDELTVKHFSNVDYHLNKSGDNLTVYSANRDGSYSNTYSHRITCNKTDDSIEITREVGAKTVDTTAYDFLCLEGGKITVLDVTNKNGVKTRSHFKDEELLYSYEIGLENDGFVNDRYCGDVQINNVLNNSRGISVKGVQKHCDCNSIILNQTFETDVSSEYELNYVLSGWIKVAQSNASDAVNLIVTGNNNTSSFDLPNSPVGEWTYFSIAFPWNTDRMCLNIENAEAKDLRIKMLPVAISTPTNTDTFFKESDVLILEGADVEDDVCLYPNIDCQFYNGSTIIGGEVTMRDVLQHKINQMYGTHINTIFYDDYKKAVTSQGALCIKYRDNGTINTVSVFSLAVGKLTFLNGKKYLTKTNFYYDEDQEKYFLISRSYINNVCYKEEIYNENLDIISSTVEDATVHYDYVSTDCGLLDKKTVAPKGINKTFTTRADVMVTQYNYDEALTKVNSVVDEFRNITYYETDDTWGVVTETTLPDGTVITNNYDDDKCTLLSREFSNEANPRITSFAYADGKLASLTHGDSDDNITFTFTYDDDKLANVKKGSSIIEEHEHTDTTLDSYYPTKAGKLYSVLSDFDKYERLTQTDGAVHNVYDVKCEYDENGDLISCMDNASAVLATSEDLAQNQTSKYHYNDQRQLVKKEIENSEGAVISEETFGYDEIGRLTSDVCTYDKANSKSIRTVTLYEKEADNPLADNTVNRYSYYLNNAVSPIAQSGYNFDSFNRISSKFCSINGKEFTKSITYDKSRPRMLLESLSGRPLLTSNYEYDNMGRIVSESSGGYVTTYAYDEYGQLIREDNQALDKTFKYMYNNDNNNKPDIGNLWSVKTYPYTPKGTEPSGNPTTTSFEYSDNSNPDRLTKCGYKNITYDSACCPTTYGSKHLDWTYGKLTKYYDEEDPYGFDSSESTEFTYNGFGQRVKKSYSYYPGSDYSGDFTIGKEVTYDYDHSGRLIREVSTEYFTESASENIELIFLYDESGMIGFMHSRNGSTPQAYYYQRNLLGDIVAIYNTNGTKVASYTYDAWGNCTATGSMAPINPIRYRGYYWDSETGWYCLNARYYSPEWRRFISPDDTAYLDPESVNGLNLYCYCNNDPINFVDPSGHIVIAALIYGGLIGFAFGFGFSVAGQYVASNGDWDKVNWGMAFYDGFWGAANGVLAATSITAPLAMLAGAGMGGISSIGSDLIFNKGSINWDGVIINTFLGGVAGLIAGSGSGITIDKYVHSKDILNRTIANGTTRAIGRQASAMYKHMLPLVDSGIRYILGNGIGTITSKGITVT